MYSPSQIANYFISSHKEDETLTPMKIIKLVYIAHGWYLALSGKPLITEAPQAWKYGPVIPSLYYRFKSYRNSKVTEDVENDIKDEDTKKFLDKVWSVYGKYTGIELSTKTHQPDTPWSVTWKKAIEDIFIPSLEIPNELIKKHYKSMINS